MPLLLFVLPVAVVIIVIIIIVRSIHLVDIYAIEQNAENLGVHVLQKNPTPVESIFPGLTRFHDQNNAVQFRGQDSGIRDRNDGRAVEEKHVISVRSFLNEALHRLRGQHLGGIGRKRSRREYAEIVDLRQLDGLF